MARCFLLTLVLAGCSVSAVDGARPAGSDGPQGREGLVHIERIERVVETGTPAGPEKTVHTLEAVAGPLRPTSQFGGQEGEPVVSPPGETDPATPPDVATDGDLDGFEGSIDSSPDPDSDSDDGPAPPPTADTGDTGDTDAE